MGNTKKHDQQAPRPVSRQQIFALIAHLRDPETDQRIIDDPVFQAAAGIVPKKGEKVA